MKNVATRIMSNGVEVLVKEKNADGKLEQRQLKFLHITSLKPTQFTSSSSSKQTLLTSAVATVINHQQISALFPLNQFMQHNYIIKTCMTTYTYLTTVVQNKRSAISTFETIVSVVTTESLTSIYATDVVADLKPTKTKYMEVKTIQPTSPTNIYMSNYQKTDKRIDNEEDSGNFDVIQPSEVSHIPCTTSCSCSHSKTESLKTNYGSNDSTKTSKHDSTVHDLRPTNKETFEKKTKYGPYEFEGSTPLAPTDRVVEKYTEVINDYSDEKDSNSVEETELLTNEQAPTPTKTNVVNKNSPEKNKPEKIQKPNKNKFMVADLLKLGTLGIKSLTQLAPVIEKMTGGFIKRQEALAKTTTTTVKPAEKLTAYNVNKRIDSDLELKHNNFPIYIPVDELETSESQISFSNATLHQSLAWAADHKHSKAHIVPPKVIHESPLVNGGIPISPGEIITANSDVIVGKPAVGGPFTLTASGIKLQNPVNPPPIDSLLSANEQFLINENPLNDQYFDNTKVDDSFDLRPPDLPKVKSKPNTLSQKRPTLLNYNHQSKIPYHIPSTMQAPVDHWIKTDSMKTSNTILSNHGRPVFLDYIPSLAKPTGNKNTPLKHHVELNPSNEPHSDIEIADNSPSSSEVVNTQIRADDEYTITGSADTNKPFLVDIQPSRVANVLIPHGSSTAIVFAGSSEPHKTGNYVDDPLPYPEPGYFGSFSIDAPQMTNVHNVAPTNKHIFIKPNINTQIESYRPNTPSYKTEEPPRNDLILKWKDYNRPIENTKPPVLLSTQETHVKVVPQITSYNPEVFSTTNSDYDKYNKGKDKIKDTKEIIDKEYENYLAVPPPPPKIVFKPNSPYDQNKPYSQRPIVHTKPVQDMKVFLNIQHPVPKEKTPQKVTSEIYFAAQVPNSNSTPTYTFHIPPAPIVNTHNKYANSNIQQFYPTATNVAHAHSHYPILSSQNAVNSSVSIHENNDKTKTYAVTLNTATNVASNIGDDGQIIGSSVQIPINSSPNIGLNANIPIGTNFAIKVDDSLEPFETYNLQGSKKAIVYDEHGRVPIEVSVGDNRWNKSTADKVETTIVGHNYYNEYVEKPILKNPVYPSIPPSINSHANFPMTNEDTTLKDTNIEYSGDVKSNEQKRPAKLIPNIPTNSHGWYSSVLHENNVNNIKHVEGTTRKNIPLIHEYNDKDSLPNFGQKIDSIGKPPSEFWPKHPQGVTNFKIGKPFTKPISTEKPFTSIPPFTTKPYNFNYRPSNIGIMKQPAYIIPIKNNNNEITTLKTNKQSTQKPKPVFENSEEIYDGEEESDSMYDNDGEVSLESMKVPVVTTSNEINGSTSSELTLLQEEVMDSDKNNIQDSKSGIQTEKPFGMYNKTAYYSSTTSKPIYKNSSYNMKPRPFTINTAAVLDHQLQQPHWQINQMMENATNASYEENVELNIGEELHKPIITSSNPSHHEEHAINPNLTLKPVFTRLNSTHVVNDSNIITSTVHIKDKKPLIVEKSTDKPNLTTSEITKDFGTNQTSSEIIDLSPPPPTLDNNFNPSTNSEMIMGMSPPPPRIPSNARPPTRISHTPRPIPVRSPPPYRPKPQRILPPRYQTQKPIKKHTINDEVSTHRPINKDEASTYKPLKKDVMSTFKPNNRDNVSTYRPAYNILNNIRRPVFNRDQPSSQLLPPPRDLPSKVAFNDIPSPTIKPPSIPKIVFPTPISSGWLTSSDVDYYSSFNFAPTSIRFPVSHPSELSVIASMPDESSENSYSYEVEYSSELGNEIRSEKPLTDNSKETDNKYSIQNITLSNQTDLSDYVTHESSENISTIKMIVTTMGNKNRTRKPYPDQNNDMKPNTSKFKMPPKATLIIAPTKILSRPETLSPTQHVSIKKIVRPVNTRIPDIIEGTVIESSEIYEDEDFIKPTQVLKDNVQTTSQIILSSSIENPSSHIIVKPMIKEIQSVIQPTHHAGNEVKISDEIIPTKTEFRTTVVTHTKTLLEPPKTVSSIGFVNLTHTLTVTHTQTSLVSQSEGAVTETLILTNTQTSTIVDVVTEIHTQVQPTTIVETITKHIPIPLVEPTPVLEIPSKTNAPLDDVTMSSEESDNFIIKTNKGSENVQKIENEGENDNDSFFVVLNKSQNGGHLPPVNTEVETGDFDGITRNEQVNNNGVSQVLFGEILLAGAPYLETTNVGTANILNISAVTYGKECHPDCKASRNERCQRIDSIMKCVCRPGFARMFPDRPCKPTYTYSVKLALSTQGNESLEFHKNLLDNSSKEYQSLAGVTHEGINRMVMQSDLRDVYHGVHINGFHPVEMKSPGGDSYQGVINDFYVQLSDNAHESRLKEVIEKYLRNNNYSLGGTDVIAAGEFMEQLDVSDFDECTSGHFHDCSEHAQCFNLRGTYTCSCLEGFADLSVNTLYPGRICSAEPVGCEKCNYHGACYSRDDRRLLCECFQWYTGSTCQINLKVVLISLVVLGALLTLVLTACAVLACRRTRPPQRSIVACIQSMPSLHQGAMPSKQRTDRRALISERGDTGDASSVQNASLPYMPTKRPSSTKKIIMSDPPAHDPPPPPAPAVMIPRARLHAHHGDSRENLARKRSLELSSEAKLISYLESGATVSNNEMRRKHSLESSYTANKDRHINQGALVSAGFKVSTTVRADESAMRDDRDDLSSVNKADLEADLARFDSLRKSYSHEDLSEWTDGERRLGELTLSEARSIGGTLPASTGRAASSTRLTHQEANTMAERDLGSTFLLPHVHLYKPDLTSDVSEFDSL